MLKTLEMLAHTVRIHAAKLAIDEIQVSKHHEDRAEPRTPRV